MNYDCGRFDFEIDFRLKSMVTDSKEDSFVTRQIFEGLVKGEHAN